MGRNPQSQLKRAREQALKERRERKQQKKEARALGEPEGAPIRPSDEIVMPNVPQNEATPTPTPTPRPKAAPTPEPALTPAEPSST